MKSMSKSAIAVLVFAGSMTVANASLTGADLAAANSYFNSHPDIEKYAPWVRTNALSNDTLSAANNTLVSNSYYDPVQGKVIYISQIGAIAPPVPMSTLTPSKPAIVLSPPNSVVVAVNQVASTNTVIKANEPGLTSTIPAPVTVANTTASIVSKPTLIVTPPKQGNTVPPLVQNVPLKQYGSTPLIPGVINTQKIVTSSTTIPLDISKAPLVDPALMVKGAVSTAASQNYVAHDDPTGIPVKISTNSSNGITGVTTTTATTDTNAFKTDQDRQDKALQATSDKAAQAYNTGMYAESLAVDAQAVTAANKAAVANVQSRQQAQETTIQNHSNQLANHEQRITELEHQNNNFQNLKDDVDNNRKRAAVGVASVAAMSNVPQVTDSQTFAVGAGVGGYDSQGAVAVGFSARITDHIVTKASVGAGSFGGATYGAGVSFG